MNHNDLYSMSCLLQDIEYKLFSCSGNESEKNTYIESLCCILEANTTLQLWGGRREEGSGWGTHEK